MKGDLTQTKGASTTEKMFNLRLLREYISDIYQTVLNAIGKIVLLSEFN